MTRLLICLFVVFGLAAAPVMASVCADDCNPTVSHQHQGAGKKQSDDDNCPDAAHHCCHVNVALPDRIAQEVLSVSSQTLAIGKDGQLTSYNPSPLLEPPSRA